MQNKYIYLLKCIIEIFDAFLKLLNTVILKVIILIIKICIYTAIHSLKIVYYHMDVDPISTMYLMHSTFYFIYKYNRYPTPTVIIEWVFTKENGFMKVSAEYLSDKAYITPISDCQQILLKIDLP